MKNLLLIFCILFSSLAQATLTKIQLRRDTSANWTLSNPILSPGELGFESETRYFKIGDGFTAWTSLPYASGLTALGGDVTATGPGLKPATVQFVGGQSATAVATGAGLANAATSANTPSTLVARDGSGNFTATTVTAALVGNATTATTATSATSATTASNVTGTVLVPHGGTGDTSFTANSVVVGNGTSALNIVTNNASGTNEFLSQSSAGAPSWAALLAADIPSLAASKITSGQLAETQGGTGVSSTAVFPSSGTVVTEAASETLTNKTIAGASNTLTVRAASDITGQLPIASGGTNAATSQAAINNISQLTTKGDLEVFDGTNTTRFAAGADGTVLSAQAASPAGVRWVSVFSNPMTTSGDMIAATTAGVAVRVAAGTATTFLQGGTPPTFAQINLASGGGVQANVGQIAGATSNSTANAGNIGEYIETARASGPLSMTTGTFGDVDPGVASWDATGANGLSVTAGTWDVQGTCVFVSTTSTTVAGVECFIGTARQNSSAGQDGIRNDVEISYPPSSVLGVAGIVISTPTWRVNLASPTNYFLKADATFGISTLTVLGNIRATRVR